MDRYRKATDEERRIAEVASREALPYTDPRCSTAIAAVYRRSMRDGHQLYLTSQAEAA